MPTYLSPGVYIEEKESGSRPIEGAGTAVAAFVGLTEKGPVDKPTLITNWSQYTDTFGDFTPTGYTPLSVYSYFNNGGGSAYVVRVGPETNGNGNLDLTSGKGKGKGSKVPTPAASLASGAKTDTPAYTVQAVDPDAPSGITIEIQPEPAGEGKEASELFTLLVKQGGKPVETHEHLSPRRGKQHATTVVKEASKLIRLQEVGSLSIAERLPAGGEVELVMPETLPMVIELESDEIVGDAGARSGLGGLEAIEGVTMVAVPDLMAAYETGQIDLEGVQVVQQSIIDHCENMGDRMAVLDTPPDLTPQQVKTWRVKTTGYDSKFAAMYWPWIKVFNPANGAAEFIPPSAAVAGIWGRNDDTRGVHKAPANEVVRGAVGVAADVTRGEHDQLNPVGVNVIRSFPGRGIRVWGARTLSSDPAWRYLNVRRLFNYIESSILTGTQWVVFEPNDLELWQRIKRTITGFLTNVWRDGALFGATPAEAFYVKCDAETNPPEVIDAGRVVIEIGICPVKPAEFVVFRLSQFSAGGAAIEA